MCSFGEECDGKDRGSVGSTEVTHIGRETVQKTYRQTDSPDSLGQAAQKLVVDAKHEDVLDTPGYQEQLRWRSGGQKKSLHLLV